MKLADILAGGLGGLIDSIGSVVDKFHLSKEEKAQIQIALEDAANRQFAIIEQSVQARYEAVTKIIQAEMASGDSYTKRARPTVVYFGLVLFGVQVIGQFFGREIVIPPDFTYAWAGIVGVWMIGRSYEKVQGPGGRSKWVTGSATPPAPDL